MLSQQESISECKIHKGHMGHMGIIFERMDYGEKSILRVQEFVGKENYLFFYSPLINFFLSMSLLSIEEMPQNL